MFLDDSKRFKDSSWFMASSVVPAFTLHALYRETDQIECFGIKGQVIDEQLASKLIAAIESLPTEALQTDYGYVRTKVASFNGVGHISGAHRRFLDGWANDTSLRIVHVFPSYDCELLARETEKQFLDVFRTLDIFDVTRQANPHFEIQMQGGKSKLQIKKWAKVPYSQLTTYAQILENETGSSLSIRNVRGETLDFGGKNGWKSAPERIKKHVFISAAA